MLLGLIGVTGQVCAEQLQQREDVANWVVQSSAHRCVLEQDITDFGKVQFVAMPSGPLQLQLLTGLALVANATVSAQIRTPPWKADLIPGQTSASLVLHRTAESDRTYLAEDAEPLLQALAEGWQVMLPLALMEHPKRLKLVLQPVRLQTSLQDFRACQLHVVAEKPKKPVVHVHKPVKQKSKSAQKSAQTYGEGHKGPHDSPNRLDTASPSVQSPYQDWLKQHESSRHALKVTRGHNGKSLPQHLTLMFAPGKANISKALQDDMEAMVKEWEIRQGEGRSMSLLIEEDATADQFNLIRERLDAVHAYLLARGLAPSRVHMRIRRVASSPHIDQVDVSIGD